MFHQRFYHELGHVLYALAATDGVVQDKECKVLDEAIASILKKHPDFEERTDVKDLMLTKLAFQKAAEKKEKVHTAIRHFVELLQKEGARLSPESSSIARRLIHDVAHAYKGVNAGEARELKELFALLEK